MATPAGPQTQVKLQLTTNQPDIALPESTGPILVNTSKFYMKYHFIIQWLILL